MSLSANGSCVASGRRFSRRVSQSPRRRLTLCLRYKAAASRIEKQVEIGPNSPIATLTKAGLRLLFDLDSRSNTSVRTRTPSAKNQIGQKLGVSRRASTHDRILTQGLDILSQAGFSGVTLGVLAQRVGISKSGLFAHFKSIEQVQLAILQQMMDVWTANVLAPSMRADKGLPRLLSYFLHWLGWTSKAGLSGGCPLAAALFELDDKQGPLRNHCS